MRTAEQWTLHLALMAPHVMAPLRRVLAVLIAGDLVRCEQWTLQLLLVGDALAISAREACACDELAMAIELLVLANLVREEAAQAPVRRVSPI
jgi:hypothetical protein